MDSEVDSVRERYDRRRVGDRYSMLRPEVWMSIQERQRAMLRLLTSHMTRPVAQLRLLEVGCGHGQNLLELMQIGFRPSHLEGCELLPERAAKARTILPESLQLHVGDASVMDFDAASFDIVYTSVVFSSLLNDAFQVKLADRMWYWVRPGGAVLWYDFVYDNPCNRDVRGVCMRRVRQLFPEGSIEARKVTLAPPIARRVVRFHTAFYTLFNLLPWLRTHRLCWIEKR